MNNREHTREHMIFQLMVNTHLSESYLKFLTDKELIELYKRFEIEGVKVK